MNLTTLRKTLGITKGATNYIHSEDYFVRKFRLYPTSEQSQTLTNFYGSIRYVYNKTLGDSGREYAQWKLDGENPETKPYWNYYKSQNLLPSLRKQEGLEFLKVCPSQALQASVKNLSNSFSNFFQGNSKYPKFKKRKDGGSIFFPQGVSIDGNSVRVPKFLEGIRTVIHDLPGEGYTIGGATISTDPDGKSYISITWRKDTKKSTGFSSGHTSKKKTKRDSIIGTLPSSVNASKVLGIDLGLMDFATITNGTNTVKLSNPRFRKKSATKIKKASRHLSRCQKGSSGRKKAKLRLARVHSRAKNKMTNFIHQLTNILGESQAQAIVIETLDIKSMMKKSKGSKGRSKSFSDTSLFEFIRQLTYKLTRRDKVLVNVDQYFPSSKLCHHCGWKYTTLDESQRSWTCYQCNDVNDRDGNASLNIRSEGLRILQTAGGNILQGLRELSTITPLGESVRPTRNRGLFSMTLESNKL